MTRAARLSIRTRLLALVAFVNLLLVASLGYAWHALAQSGRTLETALASKDAIAAALSDIQQAEVEFKMQLLHLKNVLIRGQDPEQLEVNARGVFQSGDRFRDDLKRAVQSSRSAGIDPQPIDALIDSHEKLANVYANAIDAYRTEQPVEEIEKGMRGEFFATSDALEKLGKRYRAESARIGREAGEQAAARNHELILQLGAVALLVVALSSVVGLAAANAIVRPLRRAAALAQAVAGGDLTAEIATEAPGELGDLLRALERMNRSLAQIVYDIRRDADAVLSGATQIASGNRELSARAQDQATSLEETAASVEEMAANVTRNAEQSRRANDAATEASAVARQGGMAVEALLGTMESIHASSRRISEIVGVIDSIAFQTNILALNAAVEAARAGEEGRGFAVVASEVRSLAQGAARSAREIAGLIQESVACVQAGTAGAHDAGETIRAAVESVERVSSLLAGIAAASHEQSAGIGQVSQATASLDRATQQNAAWVEQSSAASENLRQLAARMAASVAAFRVPVSHDGAFGADGAFAAAALAAPREVAAV